MSKQAGFTPGSDAAVASGCTCDVCGRAHLPGITRACDHSPEEYATAAVKAIMAKHGPELRAALSKATPTGSDGNG